MPTPPISIIWSAMASMNIDKIHHDIEEHYSKKRADRYVRGLIDKVGELEEFPERYPPCLIEKLRNEGWRCFTYKKQYVVVYEIDENEVIIIAIVWSRRSPRYFEDLV